MDAKTLDLPKMVKIRQKFDLPSLENIEETIVRQFKTLQLEKKIIPEQTVAITAGSRGISNIARILKSVVSEFHKLGAQPFVFPAMGSHGGGTVKGQVQVLKNYGITPEYLGCEIKATMEVRTIGQTALGTGVYLDEYAAQADHIFVVNRIKPHTLFSGQIESGLLKMCLIGMGKRQGAREYHRAIAHHSWEAVVNAVSGIIINNIPILGGLAIVENAREELAHLVAVSPEKFREKETELLAEARRLMATLPFKEIDLLIVDEMGKEISGTGMDTNITGRKKGSPMRVHRIFVRDLTEKSHGNAQGIGLADFTTRKLVEKMDSHSTYLNSQTAFRTDSCKIPMTLENDYEALQVAQKMTGETDDPSALRIVWVKNTLELEEFYASEVFIPQIVNNPALSVIRENLSFMFDHNLSCFLEEN